MFSLIVFTFAQTLTEMEVSFIPRKVIMGQNPAPHSMLLQEISNTREFVISKLATLTTKKFFWLQSHYGALKTACQFWLFGMKVSN